MGCVVLKTVGLIDTLGDTFCSDLLIGINAAIDYQVSNYIKVIVAVNPEYFRLKDDVNDTTDKGAYILFLIGITVSM